MGPPPPGCLTAKRGDDAGMSSEDDGLPRSPPEMCLLHDTGTGTAKKASLACITYTSVHTHSRSSRGLWWPLCSPEIPMPGVARR